MYYSVPYLVWNKSGDINFGSATDICDLVEERSIVWDSSAAIGLAFNEVSLICSTNTTYIEEGVYLKEFVNGTSLTKLSPQKYELFSALSKFNIDELDNSYDIKANSVCNETDARSVILASDQLLGGSVLNRDQGLVAYAVCSNVPVIYPLSPEDCSVYYNEGKDVYEKSFRKKISHLIEQI